MAKPKAEVLAKMAAQIAKTERAVLADPKGRHACPVCRHEWLKVTDRSARPLMLWYEIGCSDCDFNDTFNAPLSGSG